MLDFVRAAFPWTILGICLAIYFVKQAGKKKEAETQESVEDYTTLGMCIGLSLGIAFSTAIHINMGTGMSLGMIIGMAVGGSIKK